MGLIYALIDLPLGTKFSSVIYWDIGGGHILIHLSYLGT